jgi:hypothetical protein
MNIDLLICVLLCLPGLSLFIFMCILHGKRRDAKERVLSDKTNGLSISEKALLSANLRVDWIELEKDLKAESLKEPKRTKEQYLKEEIEELKPIINKIESKGLTVFTELSPSCREYQGGRLHWRVVDITNRHITVFFDSDLLIKFAEGLKGENK